MLIESNLNCRVLDSTSETLAPAGDMSHYTKVVGDNQAEILFKSGTKFKVLSVEKNTKGIYEINMSEL